MGGGMYVRVQFPKWQSVAIVAAVLHEARIR